MRDLTLRHFILLQIILFHFSMLLWNRNTVRSKLIQQIGTLSSGNNSNVGYSVYSTAQFGLPAGYIGKPTHLTDLEGKIHGSQVARATALCAVVPNKCGLSEWNSPPPPILEPRTSKRSLDF